LTLDPLVNVGAWKAPRAPDFERWNLLGGSQTVQSPLGNLEVFGDFGDRQDVRFRLGHWQKHPRLSKLANLGNILYWIRGMLNGSSDEESG
jgi:hypothetical protein